MELLQPWKGGDFERTVCTDSYFAAVGTINKLEAMGFNFIGVIKTATRMYPHLFLNSFELLRRGDSKSLVSLKDNGKMKAALQVCKLQRFL